MTVERLTARRRLASRALGDVVAEWEATHGAFTSDELAAAKARLALIRATSPISCPSCPPMPG